jgi:hypothetical protein
MNDNPEQHLVERLQLQSEGKCRAIRVTGEESAKNA